MILSCKTMDFNFSLRSNRADQIIQSIQDGKDVKTDEIWDISLFLNYLKSNNLNPSIKDGLSGTILLLLRSYELTKDVKLLDLLDYSIHRLFSFIKVSNRIRVIKEYEEFDKDMAYILFLLYKLTRNKNLKSIIDSFDTKPAIYSNSVIEITSDVTLKNLHFQTFNTRLINILLFNTTFPMTAYLLAKIGDDTIFRERAVLANNKKINLFLDEVVKKYPQFTFQVLDIYKFEKSVDRYSLGLKSFKEIKLRDVEKYPRVNELIRLDISAIEKVNFIKNLETSVITSKWNWTQFFGEESFSVNPKSIIDNLRKPSQIIETVLAPSGFRFKSVTKHIVLTENQKIVLSCFENEINYLMAYKTFEDLFDVTSEQDILRAKKLFNGYVSGLISFGYLIERKSDYARS